MRFVSLRSGGSIHLGVVAGEAILDLALDEVRSALKGLPLHMRDVFEPPARTAVESLLHRLTVEASFRSRLAESGALVPLNGAPLGAPIEDPSLLLAIGMNYHDHLREMGAKTPEIPYSFTKNRASIIGPYDEIVLPRSHPDSVDLEGELVIVIGAPCYDISEDDAPAYIGGYTIANDVSARNWIEPVFRCKEPMDVIGTWEVNLLGKQFPTFCPLGPYLVTSHEIPNVLALALQSRVNGASFQSSNTAELIFSPAKIVSYYSKFYQFEAGDLILTGTPSGVGFTRTPKYFLQPGDVVEVEIEGLGSLANRVVSVS